MAKGVLQQTFILAGPILRKLSPTQITLWLVSSQSCQVTLELYPAGQSVQVLPLDTQHHRQLQGGSSLYYQLIQLELDKPLPRQQWIGYDLLFSFNGDAPQQRLTELLPELNYPGQPRPGFMLNERVGTLLHGSCRKPHHPGADGLVEADQLLASYLSDTSQIELVDWPALLLMSGDQIYADDVAAPLLSAIHELTQVLQLPIESMQKLGLSGIEDSAALVQHPRSYYQREQLLPHIERNLPLLERFFGGVRKPIFTSDTAQNHLISLSEYLLIYLLCWSPTPWQLIAQHSPDSLTPLQRKRFAQEQSVLAEFQAGLPAVQRLLAHLPCAMIFDDHDISDDWNLNRDWEEQVLGHPLSTRIVGNGLIAYLLNQGWGNAPQQFSAQLLNKLQQALMEPGTAPHQQLVNELIHSSQWHYSWPSQPPLVVLDTRTRRWRSERSAIKPSGLLDWEALTELQQQLSGQQAVLLASAAPIFGVKLIEVIQRIFTFFGKPLLVDAENWMAHPGTANGILNVFKHTNTPHTFVVLSGDVHYSFVYDIELKGSAEGPEIWQICSSGLRNSFPAGLLTLLDRLNRWLYAPRSPLNWFTRRRRMRITPRKPLGTPHGRRLLNGSGIGVVELDPDGRPRRIRQLQANQQWITFERRDDEANWH